MARSQRVAVIINPISGTGGRLDVARRRAERAAALLATRGVGGDVFLTGHPGHARELAKAALARGVSTVVAWGGDGTVNEVASALVFREAALGIVPGGSGNGLARALGIPCDPDRALETALAGREYVMDAGELDGRLFFNVAGLGLDARVAHRFAAEGLVRRGFLRYLAITVHELFSSSADTHTVVADGRAMRTRALLVAVANARQYGNGAVIAPSARVDDGLLDVVVVGDRSPIRALAQMPRVFMGRIASVPGVTIRTAVEIEITSARPVLYHVDGEPYVGGASIVAQPRPQALRVMVPAARLSRAG
ncbi:MAG: diacylglycerol kinase family lipid kinase [Acidobacteria bacterium]|nr:diacylglycerol kinase family lipid kinase [Acidobacteriota bacterium]